MGLAAPGGGRRQRASWQSRRSQSPSSPPPPPSNPRRAPAGGYQNTIRGRGRAADLERAMRMSIESEDRRRQSVSGQRSGHGAHGDSSPARGRSASVRVQDTRSAHTHPALRSHDNVDGAETTSEGSQGSGIATVPPIPVTGSVGRMGRSLKEFGEFLSRSGAQVLEDVGPADRITDLVLKPTPQPCTGKRIYVFGRLQSRKLDAQLCECVWRNDQGKVVGHGIGFRPTMDHVGTALHVTVTTVNNVQAHVSSMVVCPDPRIAGTALNFIQDKKPMLFDVQVISGSLQGKSNVGLLINKQKIKIQVKNKTISKQEWGESIRVSCDFEHARVLRLMVQGKVHEFRFEDQKHRDCAALMMRSHKSLASLDEMQLLAPRRGPQTCLARLLRAGSSQLEVMSYTAEEIAVSPDTLTRLPRMDVASMQLLVDVLRTNTLSMLSPKSRELLCTIFSPHSVGSAGVRCHQKLYLIRALLQTYL